MELYWNRPSIVLGGLEMHSTGVYRDRLRRLGAPAPSKTSRRQGGKSKYQGTRTGFVKMYILLIVCMHAGDGVSVISNIFGTFQRLITIFSHFSPISKLIQYFF